jgi:hypothetical protein
MDSDTDALKQLDVADFQSIDFVKQRKEEADAQLLTAVERCFKEWSEITLFIPKLQSNNKAERLFAIRKIGEVGKMGISASYLHPFLKSPDWETRTEAVEALASVADETSVEPLIELIREGLNHPQWNRGNKHERFSSSSSPEDLQLSIKMSGVVESAIVALGWIGSLKSAPFLRELAIEKDALAITSLGYLRDNDSVEILSNILDNSWREDLILEFACIWALGRIRVKTAAKSINNWLRKYLPIIEDEEIETDEEVNGTSHKNAEYLWPDLEISHQFAESFVFDHRINVVKAAIIVLGFIQNLDYVATLVEILLLTQGAESATDVPSIHCATAFALGLLGDKKALPELTKLKLSYGGRPPDSEINRHYLTDTYYPIDFVSEAIKMIEHAP